jgi:hypothetical protein
MTVYLAAAFLATVSMWMLHAVEWRTASAMAAQLRSGSKPVVEVRRLRRAIRFEAAYYLLILPYVYVTFDTLLGRLLAVAAIYHWGGLALGEGSGLFDRWAAGTAATSNGKTVIAMSAVAVLDVAEMALLAWLLWILVAPVTAVTGIAAVPA